MPQEKIMTKPNTPIFSTTVVDGSPVGLSKREYFALHILQGLLAHPNCTTNAAVVVASAVQGADHLIAELNKETTNDSPKGPLYDPMYA